MEKAAYAKVNMGKAILDPKKIPVKAEGDTFISQEIMVGDKPYTVTCVSMGNPHCVVFTEGIDTLDLEKTGPEFEQHPLFPDRINTEFVEVIDEHTLKMRVWERGAGETISWWHRNLCQYRSGRSQWLLSAWRGNRDTDPRRCAL